MIGLRPCLLIALLLSAVLLPGAGRAADPADPESVFWQSAVRSGNAAEIHAYLDVFPNGRYRELAQIALDLIAQRDAKPPPQPAPPPAGAAVHLRPGMAVVSYVGGVPVDVDATALRTSSNLRLVVVPSGAPEGIDDPQRFAEESTSITASRLHLTVPSGPPGLDEVRLYYIAPFGSTYVLAARAPVTVQPGVAGAVMPLELSREAARVGPARFEALHRDRPLLVQAAFLGLTPRTDWSVQWFEGQPVGEVPQQVAVIRLGVPNAAPDYFGSTGEAVCLLNVADQRLLDRLTTLSPGQPIVVSGIPTRWNSASVADPIVLSRCSFWQ